MNPKRILPLVIIAAVIASARSDQTSQRNLLGWRIEKVIVRGSSLPKLKTTEISKLRLLAFHSGKLEPIPFQIDERDAKNQFVLPDPSGKIAQDADNGKLDDNDELVFMASDAGERGKIEGAAAFHEIGLKNLNDNSMGYVYAASYAANPPRLSGVDYVAYKKAGEHEEISTSQYVQTFDKSRVFFSDLSILPAAGGNGKNFVDKLKMRTEVHALGQQVKIARSEEDFKSAVTGLKDGPVRVIRRNETRMTIVLSMKSPVVIVDATFYKNSYEVPTLFSLPFRMDIVASDVVYRQGIDLNKNAVGMKYYSNFLREGVVFDGRMTPLEESLSKSPVTHKWGMVSGEPGTLLYVGIWAPGTPMKKLAYYRDDASQQDPPEREPGLMMYGFRFEDVLSVKGETYAFNLLNYIVPNFDGNIDAISALADHPIEVTVR